MIGLPPMRMMRIQRAFSVMMAVFLLSLAVISRAPQSKCRCGARKTTSAQEAKPCVFGQMRSLTGAYVIPASVSPKDESILVSRPREASVAYRSVFRVGIADRPRERSPPASLPSQTVSI